MSLHGIGLNDAALIYHPGAQGDAACVRHNSAGIVHRTGRQRDLRTEAMAVGPFADEHALPIDEFNVALGRGQGAVVFNLLGN